MHKLVLFLLFVALLAPAIGQEAETNKEEQARVKKIGDTRYKLGEIEFDAKTKEIFVPVEVNQREGGPMEYVLVHESGKVHESILTTRARPMNFQIVLKLLKFTAGEGDIFDKLLPSEDRQIRGEKSKNPGDAVDFEVRWKDGEEEKSILINKWIVDGETIKNEGDPGEPMPDHPWNYTGSVVMKGSFLAELEGSIIAIYLDPVSLFNTSVPGTEVDERWGANGAIIPEIGTKATLVVKKVANN